MDERGWAELASYASKLRPETLPVDVLSICRQLGVGIEIGRPRSLSHKGDLVVRDNGFYVVVNRNKRNYDQNLSTLSVRERQTVAHELAHFLAIQLSWPPPTRRSEYWALEKMCDEFAYTLLLPPSIHPSIDSTISSKQLADAISDLCMRAQVTPKLACRALFERPQRAIAAWISRDYNQNSGRLGWVRWSFGSAPEWYEEGTSRRAVYAHEPLAAVMNSLPNMRPGDSEFANVGLLRDIFVRKHGTSDAAIAAVVR